jgi:hypothetical protein
LKYCWSRSADVRRKKRLVDVVRSRHSARDNSQQESNDPERRSPVSVWQLVRVRIEEMVDVDDLDRQASCETAEKHELHLR